MQFFRNHRSLTPLLLVIGGAAVVAFGGLPAVHYLEAPKFKAMNYVGTDASYGCWAIVTDAVCYTNFKYTATGTEGQIAAALTQEMKERGYSLGKNESDYHISCGTADPSDSEGSLDQYSFEKPVMGKTQPANMYIEFSPPGPEKSSSSNNLGFGCGNLSGRYNITVSMIEAQ